MMMIIINTFGLYSYNNHNGVRAVCALTFDYDERSLNTRRESPVAPARRKQTSAGIVSYTIIILDN